MPFEGRPVEWDALLARAGRSALEQSWAYGEAVAAGRGWSTHRFVLQDDEAERALVQLSERKILGGLHLARLIRGPVWLGAEPSAAAQAPIYRAIRAHYRPRRWRPLLWTPELPNGHESAALLQALGLRQMVTGYSTAWLDLRQSESALRKGLHGKWRNALKAAEASDLEVRCDELEALDWLLVRHDRHRRRRRFIAPGETFTRTLAEAAPGSDRLCLMRALIDGRAVSAALFICHGASATYEVAWSGTEGRRVEAQSLVLWRALLELKRRGVSWLDLGGLSASAPGLARFKLGLGAEPVTLLGTYL